MVYRFREGVHGEFCVDRGKLVFERYDTVARAATAADAKRMVDELNQCGAVHDVAPDDVAPVSAARRSHGFGEAHQLLIGRVRAVKMAIIQHLESGDRDFMRLRAMIESYADLQSNADKISGQA